MKAWFAAAAGWIVATFLVGVEVGYWLRDREA